MGKGGHLLGKLLDRDLFAQISLIAVFLRSWREPGGFVWYPASRRDVIQRAYPWAT